jgi:hypothetical protein
MSLAETTASASIQDVPFHAISTRSSLSIQEGDLPLGVSLWVYPAPIGKAPNFQWINYRIGGRCVRRNGSEAQMSAAASTLTAFQ